MRKKMCDIARTAVDVIKAQSNKKTLSRGETLMLFDKVIEDNKKMGERMTGVEKRLSDMENKMDRVLAILEKKSFFEKVFLGKDAKYAWITLIVVLLILGALLGVPLTGFNGIISLGG